MSVDTCFFIVASMATWLGLHSPTLTNGIKCSLQM